MEENLDLIKVEEEKLEELVLVSNEQKKELMDSLQYMAIPYFPIGKNFIQKYILNDTEFPSVPGKLSQAATEMKARVGRIVDTNYQYNQLLLEIEEIENELFRITEELKSYSVGRKISDTITEFGSDYDYQKRKLEIERKKKNMELKMKNYRINSIKLELDNLFAEFKAYKETVSECLDIIIKGSNGAVKNLNDIDFEIIRMYDTAIKAEYYKIMAKKGMPLTAPQTNLAFPANYSEAEKNIMEKIKKTNDENLKND